MRDYFSDFERSLAETLKSLNNYSYKESKLCEMISYGIEGNGKRLRPILLLTTADIFGADYSLAMKLALGLELIHSYSLVHDDMPEMDNDTLRRGKATMHVKYGQGMALLTGDAMLNSAYEVMLSANCNDNEQYRNYIKAINVISYYAGINGMVGGQGLDLISTSNENRDSIETVVKMYEGKTSALLEAAVVAAATLCGAENQDIKNLRCFASNLGIAFQIQDDILDIESNIETLGKNVGSDMALDKKTYVSLNGIEKAKKDVIEYYQNAINALNNIKTVNPKPLILFAVKLLDRKR